MNTLEDNTIIEVRGLKKYFPVNRGLLRRKVADIRAVDNISFKVQQGETMGLVGESGCGKTTVGRCILRLYDPTGGQILFKNRDITNLTDKETRPLRREMGTIFQDPFNSLNPRKSIGKIIGEPIRVHNIVHNDREYKDRLTELFRLVGLDPSMAGRFPHEFSGGQRQRIGIARAIACNPSLVVCDEPISALDVSIQAQIINLMKDLQASLGLTYLFIAHDLSAVRHISNRIAIMYLGRLVEIITATELLQNPLHPYTKALLSAVPVPDPDYEEKRDQVLLKGEVPSPLRPPSGCYFHPRCPMAIPDCSQIIPQLRDVGKNHDVACICVS